MKLPTALTGLFLMAFVAVSAGCGTDMPEDNCDENDSSQSVVVAYTTSPHTGGWIDRVDYCLDETNHITPAGQFWLRDDEEVFVFFEKPVTLSLWGEHGFYTCEGGVHSNVEFIVYTPPEMQGLPDVDHVVWVTQLDPGEEAPEAQAIEGQGFVFRIGPPPNRE